MTTKKKTTRAKDSGLIVVEHPFFPRMTSKRPSPELVEQVQTAYDHFRETLLLILFPTYMRVKNKGRPENLVRFISRLDEEFAYSLELWSRGSSGTFFAHFRSALGGFLVRNLDESGKLIYPDSSGYVSCFDGPLVRAFGRDSSAFVAGLFVLNPILPRLMQRLADAFKTLHLSLI